MSGLFRVAQALWQRAEWAAPASVHKHLFPHLYELEELVLPLIQPELDVVQLRGPGKGCPVTVTCVGLDYGRWVLKRAIFAQEPQETCQSPVLTRYLAHTVTRLMGDIVIVAGSERVIRSLPRRNALVLPLYLEHVLDVQGSWEEIEKRLLKSNSVYNDFRLLKKYNYVLEPSRDPRDLQMYYDTMYLPTMEKRHGDTAIIVSPEETRQHFRRGCLLFVKRDGQVVAGGLCRAQGERVKLISVGIANADPQLMKEGALGALYILLIRWANQVGYKNLDLLGGPPYLGMGIFQFKRKWGTTGGLPPSLHKQVWIQFRRATPAVRQFLMDTPCAALDDKGDLYGLVFVDDALPVTPELQKGLNKRYSAPGMKGLRILAVDEFLKDVDGASILTGRTLTELDSDEHHDSPVPTDLRLA